MGFRAPLQLVGSGLGDGAELPGVVTEPRVDHGALASSAAETARPFLLRAAKACDLAGEPLAAHKARAAAILVDELQECLAKGRTPAA